MQRYRRNNTMLVIVELMRLWESRLEPTRECINLNIKGERIASIYVEEKVIKTFVLSDFNVKCSVVHRTQVLESARLFLLSSCSELPQHLEYGADALNEHVVEILVFQNDLSKGWVKLQIRKP